MENARGCRVVNKSNTYSNGMLPRVDGKSCWIPDREQDSKPWNTNATSRQQLVCFGNTVGRDNRNNRNSTCAPPSSTCPREYHKRDNTSWTKQRAQSYPQNFDASPAHSVAVRIQLLLARRARHLSQFFRLVVGTGEKGKQLKKEPPRHPSDVQVAGEELSHLAGRALQRGQPWAHTSEVGTSSAGGGG